MALTANDIRDRAAQELGILRLGQSLQNQDDVRVTQGYSEVYADLQKDSLATFAQTSVPDELAPHVIFMVAHNCMGSYGVSEARYARIMAHCGVNNETAKREMRKVVQPYFASQGPPDDY